MGTDPICLITPLVLLVGVAACSTPAAHQVRGDSARIQAPMLVPLGRSLVSVTVPVKPIAVRKTEE
jgi:hypothetical protein